MTLIVQRGEEMLTLTVEIGKRDVNRSLDAAFGCSAR